MEILYELVTVIGEYKLKMFTGKPGRTAYVWIYESGDLPYVVRE